MNTRRSARLSSLDTPEHKNLPDASSIFDNSTDLCDSNCKKGKISESGNQELNNSMTDTNNHETNETPNVPKRKGRRGQRPKEIDTKIGDDSKKSSERNGVNNDADNEIDKEAIPQKRVRSNSSFIEKSVIKENNLINLNTNNLVDNSEQNLNTSNIDSEPAVVQKRKKGRITKSKIPKKDSNTENSEHDLSIGATNSEVNVEQRRSTRLAAAQPGTDVKTKPNGKRNSRQKSSKEIEPLENTDKEASDSKEIQTKKRNARSKSRTLESSAVEEKLKEKMKVECENEEDSNLNLLKMENFSKNNSDVKGNTESIDKVNDKVEEQILNVSSVQKKRRGRPKSEKLESITASNTNTNKEIAVNSNLRKLSVNEEVDEDSMSLIKRLCRTRCDSELETSRNMSEYSRKRKRRSRFDKSTESNSQEEDLGLEESKNESDHEEGVSGVIDNICEGIYRPRKKRKKRGRPPGRTQSKHDDDYEPHHSVQRSLSKEMNKKQSQKSYEEKQNKAIVCGRCSLSLTKNQWASHNLSKHNNLGWIEGTEKPDYENDEKLLNRILTKIVKKRKSLICEKCSATQRSVPGHLSHVLFCGKSDDEIKALMVTCPGCNTVIKPSSLEYHERLHQREAEESQKMTTELTMEIGTKRKAAEKAVTKISEIVSLVKADQDGTLPADKKIKFNDLKKIVQSPNLTKRIPGLLISKWQKSIDAGQDAACSQVGCSLTFKSLEEVKEHYSKCNFTPQENYVCRICKHQSKLQSEIIQHITQNHNIEDENENAYVSGSESSSESDIDDNVDNTCVDKSQRSSKKRTFTPRNTPLVTKFKFLLKDSVCHTIYSKAFLTGFRWTLEFEEKNYNFKLLDDYAPNTFQLLEKEKSKQYFPELMESMPMASVKKSDQNIEWKTWKIFEGQCFDDFPTFFTGGPVWALAWLPIPTVLSFSDNIMQFIAVSTHPTMDKEYSVGEMYSGKNIIQIWNMGDLNHKTNEVSDPKLAYAIAHDGGTVWCLEWCPSGCYDSDDLPGFVNNENVLRRMGLLAAACSDGCIRVYSLIFPEDLPRSRTNKDEETNECLVYKTDPVLMLVVNQKMFDNKQQNWQVTKLSWTKERGHNVIVAGFSNGYVALWDLTTNSPMLKCKRVNTIFLNPFKHFLAHLHAVTKVYLVPNDNKRYLVTTSLDRHYKFWDLEDVTNPRTDQKKTYVTDACWFNHWNCILVTGDDALKKNQNHTHCCPLRSHMYRYYNIFPANTVSFTIDTSDFGNSIANGTLAGEVLAIFPHQMMYLNDMQRIVHRRRYFSIASTVEVVDFQESKNKESSSGKNDQVDYNFMPSTYKDSKDRFGLKFCDKLSHFRKGFTKVSGLNPKKTLTCEMMQNVPVEQYPFMAVNRVSWNPNSCSFLWLAVGYQNGFVRFIPFKSMASPNEWNKMLTDHIKKLNARSKAVDVDR